MAAAAAMPAANGFLSPAALSAQRRASSTKQLNMNFFKDVIGKAFENDARLDSDITKGQYDGPGGNLNDEEEDDSSFGSVGRLVNPPSQLTETQQRWRQAQNFPAAATAAGGTSTTTSSSSLLLANSKWTIDLFLTGIPARDPSNDLFASKTNISSRDRKVGLMVPEEPTVAGIGVTLLEDGSVQVTSESEFLNNSEDDTSRSTNRWKVSDDGSMIRICLNVLGYSRTVKTKGSIEKIYWSNEDEKSVQTTSAYSIPPGPLYGDAALEPGNQVGVFKWSEGVLKVEQAAGFLGAGSKMIPCGRFTVSRAD